MKLHWILATAALLLSGCLVGDEKGGIVGTWDYQYYALFSMAQPSSKTYVFSESGEVKFEYRWGSPLVLSFAFSGTWALRNDSLIIELQSCSRPDSTGTFYSEACSGPPPPDMAVYWDGNRIYGVNDSNQKRQYFDRK